MRQEYLLKTHQGQADFIDTCTTNPNGILVQMLKKFQEKKASDNGYYEHITSEAVRYHTCVGRMHASNVFSIILETPLLNEHKWSHLHALLNYFNFFTIYRIINK